MHIVYKVFCLIFFLFFCIPPGYAEEDFSLFHPKTERLDEDILIFQLHLSPHNWSLSDSIMTYYDFETEDVFVSLQDMMDALEFQIKVMPDEGLASGWFILNSQTFSLNLSSRTVLVNQRHFTLNPGDLEVIDGDLFVRPSVLSLWFPIKIETNVLNLSFIVTSEQSLPIEVRKAQELKRMQSRNASDIGTPSSHPTLVQEHTDLFNGATLDLSSSFSYNKNDSSGSFSSFDSSLIFNTILAKLDTELAIHSSTPLTSSLPRPKPTARVKAGRYDPYSDLFGFMQEFSFGDVSTPSVPLISSGSSGRGAFFSSFPSYELSADQTVLLTGELPVGWEVELYRNEELLDYLTSAEARDHRYEFRNVPTLPGLNIFHLLFYGPEGQRKTKEEKFYISGTTSSAGQFSFKASAVEVDRFVIETEDTVGNLPNKKQYVIETRYGLNDFFSLSGDFARIPHSPYLLSQSKKLSPLKESASEDFFKFGFETSYFGLLLQANVATSTQQKRYASYLSLQSQLGGSSVFLDHSEYNKLITSLNPNAHLKRKTSARFNTQIPLWLLGSLPLSFAGNYNVTETQDDSFDFSVRTGYNIFRYYLSVAYTYLTSEVSDSSENATFRLATRFGPLSLRGELQYALQPNTYPATSSLTLEYPFKKSSRLSFTWSYLYASHFNTYLLGFSNDFSFGSVGLSLSTDSDNNYSLNLTYSLGLGYDKYTKDFHFSPHTFSSTGSALARVFLDTNYDGIFNDNDQPLDNVQFVSSGIGTQEQTDEAGLVYLTNFHPRKAVDLKLKEESLSDLTWLPLNLTKTFLPRPGATMLIDFPIVVAGEISGTIYKESLVTDSVSPIRNVSVSLENHNHQIIADTLTAFDGYFSFPNLPPGTYFVYPDPFQLYKSGYYIVPRQEVIFTDDDLYPVLDDVVLRKREHNAEDPLFALLPESQRTELLADADAGAGADVDDHVPFATLSESLPPSEPSLETPLVTEISIDYPIKDQKDLEDRLIKAGLLDEKDRTATIIKIGSDVSDEATLEDEMFAPEESQRAARLQEAQESSSDAEPMVINVTQPDSRAPDTEKDQSLSRQLIDSGLLDMADHQDPRIQKSQRLRILRPYGPESSRYDVEVFEIKNY